MEDLKIFKGNKVVYKDVSYNSPQEFLADFIDQVKPYVDYFEERYESPVQTKVNGKVEIPFTKVTLLAFLKNEIKSNDDIKLCIGISYAIDVRTPYYKIYRFYYNTKTNAPIMIDNDIMHYELDDPEGTFDCGIVDNYIRKTDNYTVIQNLLSDAIPNEHEDISYELGSAIRRSLDLKLNYGYGRVKVATSVIIKAYNLIFNKEDSNFFYKERPTTRQQWLESLTSLIYEDKKDIVNLAEKTLLSSSILCGSKE